ncbi:unnamed protein product (macronuclear) [Paramecium tetraurelia]|uniref:Calcium-dependent protein kinase 1 n=1 Tax=Paramecium tetraurelia TaxID=5888 RepID=A0EID1_PARTE|nr:uncharacterized protein GSPATT00027401001 [Paramecium tetraurelia]CAK95072.1 unnamed protein product [Paramecium tetraurelia]|eukprot:XP_001462445.1 hypothetical protein (macronuclear) [Paramecium tetraurelia strain d4-2]
MGSCSGKRSQNNSATKNSGNKPDTDNSSPQKLQLNDAQAVLGNLIITSEKLGRITKDYTLLNPPLGSGIHIIQTLLGAYGEVRKAIHKSTNLMKAVKIIHKAQTSKEEQERLMNEVKMLQKLDHPNIIKIHEFYQDERFFYIVTELCTGGELFDKIRQEGSFSEKKAAEIMKQILSAINYCHDEKIVHRDLKPENLLYESDKENSMLKIIDFGTSKEFVPNQKLNQKLGTPYYIAPEVLKKKYDEKCDIWSCGVILYILLCGYPPFDGKTEEKIMEKVSKGVYSFDTQEWEEVTKEGKEFIRKMLQFDPTKRYSAQQALNDPWIKKFTNPTEFDRPLMTKVLTNMRRFTEQQKLQEAVFKFIVNQLATKEEKAELLKIFQCLDTNQDGKLSKEELLVGYSKIMKPVEAAEEVNRIFQQVDKNNSGSIDYTEFVIATIDRQQLLSKQRLQVTFRMFDKDKSGSITIDELKEIFSGIPEEMWKQVVQEFDSNSDGQISLEEFFTMMKKID